MALKGRWPIVWLIDSGGARIDPGSSHPDMISLFAGTGHLFREQVVMSGVVPQVAAMVGPGAAGTAYIPGLADYVPMVKGIGSLALGGPALVKAVTGQEIAEQELGGSKIHSEVSGVGDGEFDGRRGVPRGREEVPVVLPVELRRAAARRRRATTRSTAATSRCSTCSPRSTRKPYDMYKLIRAVVDHGDIFDIKPRFARSIITCLARIGGKSVGVVANQPMHLGGILDDDSADKAARFIQICDAFNVPLVFLQDVPGFMVGSKVEHAGIIRHGAKMLHVMSAATVPEAHGRRAQGVRRRLLRDVRAGVRAGPHRRAGRPARSA